MKIAITGGHFSPAYALIQELKGDYQFIIIGRKHTFEGDLGESFEYSVAQKEHIPFFELKTGRFQRKFTSRTIPSVLKFPVGIVNALRILREQHPDIVLSFGGYLSLPVALAAKMIGIPIVIHEQTQHAGLANKIMGNFADKILISFDTSRKYFPSNRVVLTGTPLRREVFTVNERMPLSLDKKIIYVTGGSSGSHFINQMMGYISAKLLEDFAVIHQTGDSREYHDFDNLVKLRETFPPRLQKSYCLAKFIFPEQIGWILKNASLIVSRSGINTVEEILACRKIALLIPLPYGQHNEQLQNAKLVKRLGVGEYIEQKDCTPEVMYNEIVQIMENRNHYYKKEIAAGFVHSDAIQKITNEIQLTSEEKSK